MIDTQRVIDAITQLDVGPVAKESGANLVDSWMSACAEDQKKKIVAVECGFVCWVDQNTVLIGVQDLLTDEGGVVGNEWKTTKEKTKFWNEERWFQSIKEGSQVAIYAVALNRGTYYELRVGQMPVTYRPLVTKPRIRVRAISKSEPPRIWRGEEDGVLTFTEEMMENTVSALKSKAASIRAMRKLGAIPYQLPGIWCVNQFRRECEYYGECSARKIPTGEYQPIDVNDPAYELALPYIGERVNDPELVVLGASAYSAMSECAEKYRRGTLKGNGEETAEMQIGTVLHSGVAEWYRQIRAEQFSDNSLDRVTQE